MSGLKYRLAAAPFRALERFGVGFTPRTKISYIVERIKWSIAWDGEYISRGVNDIKANTIEVRSRPERLSNCIVHFGSHYQWLAWKDAVLRSNRYIATFYHGKREDGSAESRLIDDFVSSAARLQTVVTSSSLVENRLLSWGIPKSKVVRIPIPIDLGLFKRADFHARELVRRRLKIPDDAFVVGSFQKDGDGWAEGVKPKLIKGPDVLVETLRRVRNYRDVFVLLSGPARGYVKAQLDQAGIPYAHIYVDDYSKLPELFGALDVYLNPSREEGGPKGILEAMASGVPVVSTAVGMAPDLMKNAAAANLIEPGDPEGLAQAILRVASDAGHRMQVISEGCHAVAPCDWPLVAARYYEDVYRPLLESK